MSFNWSADCSYNDQNKTKFHNKARAILRKLAEALGESNYDLRSNKGGIAVSGEITLHTDTLYVQIYQAALSNQTQVLIRKCNGRKDYTGERNHIMPASTLNDVNVLATYCQRVLAANGGVARAVPHMYGAPLA